MDEFEDVTSQEKRLMKMWNRFMRSHVVVPDSAVPTRCLKFLRSRMDQLIEHDLREEWLLHLCNFWEFGLISSSFLLSCITELDEAIAARKATVETGESTTDNDAAPSATTTATTDTTATATTTAVTDTAATNEVTMSK